MSVEWRAIWLLLTLFYVVFFIRVIGPALAG